MDPFGGFIPWNTELVVWIDQNLTIEVVGIAHGPAQSLHKIIHSQDELEAFARTAHFPEHHLVLRPESEHHQEIIKGIDRKADLLKAFEWMRLHRKRSACTLQSNKTRFDTQSSRQPHSKIAFSMPAMQHTWFLDYRTNGRFTLRRMRTQNTFTDQ
jgi:hypothetical protein